MDTDRDKSRLILNYAPMPGAFRTRVRLLCVGVLATIVVILALNSKRIIDKCGLLSLQRRCLHYVDRSEWPVFAIDDEERLMEMSQRSTDSVRVTSDSRHLVYYPRAGRVAPEWQTLSRRAQLTSPIDTLGGRMDPEGTLFLGRLKSANGTVRLVAVNVCMSFLVQSQQKQITFIITVITPAGPFTPLYSVQQTAGAYINGSADSRDGLNIIYSWNMQGLKIYSGHVVPGNESRFECGVVMGGWKHVTPWDEVLVGQLKDDGHVDLWSKGLANKELLK